MEYLIVRLRPSQSREVIVDGVAGLGSTDEVIELDAGTHTISLAPPADFSPDEITVVLANTTSINPREITFQVGAPRILPPPTRPPGTPP